MKVAPRKRSAAVAPKWEVIAKAVIRIDTSENLATKWRTYSAWIRQSPMAAVETEAGLQVPCCLAAARPQSRVLDNKISAWQ